MILQNNIFFSIQNLSVQLIRHIQTILSCAGIVSLGWEGGAKSKSTEHTTSKGQDISSQDGRMKFYKWTKTNKRFAGKIRNLCHLQQPKRQHGYIEYPCLCQNTHTYTHRSKTSTYPVETHRHVNSLLQRARNTDNQRHIYSRGQWTFFSFSYGAQYYKDTTY